MKILIFVFIMELEAHLQQKINSLDVLKDCMFLFVKADKDEDVKDQMDEIKQLLQNAQDLKSQFQDLKPQIMYESNERHSKLMTKWEMFRDKSFEIHGLIQKKKQERQKSPIPRKGIYHQVVTPNKRLLSVPNSNANKTPVSVLKTSLNTPMMPLSAYKESPMIKKIRPVAICFDDFTHKISHDSFNNIPK